MKTIFKKLMLVALLGINFLVGNASAAVGYSHYLGNVWDSIGGGGVHSGTNIYSGGFTLASITLQNTNVAAQRVQLYDSANAELHNWVSIITYTSYLTNKVTTFTTFGGTTQNNTNTSWFTTKNAAGSVLTWKPSPQALAVPGSASGGLITYTFDPPITFYQGIALTNTAIGITVTINGDPNP